jgi:UDP-N-acetylmuramoyl-tripeptide--D-alanyl-D-alanine ligase
MNLDWLGWLIIGIVGVIYALFGAPKWLRVAQREHYIAPWVSRITWLWYRVSPWSIVGPIVALVLIVVSAIVAASHGGNAILFASISAAVAAAFAGQSPIGLAVRGSSSKLAWTTRVRRLLAGWIVVTVVVGGVFVVVIGPAGVALALLLLPVVTDLALVIMAPIEKQLAKKFVVSAQKRLKQVRPKVVAITGSYGKTSTKNYVAHLVAGSVGVVASPASFNNLMGLSRAVNERVVPGTEVFIAEMGVYGTGEIRELSKYFPPDIAAITTIGEAHLARMGSRETIFQAKSEIVERASTVVLPVDETELAGLAERCRAAGKRVISVSVHPEIAADVVVDAAGGTVTVGGDTAAVSIPNVGHAINLAIAVGIATALGVPLKTLAPRLGALPDSHHRAEIQETANGLVVIDDTYNSNPVGAERALQGAIEIARERDGDLVVVTPGMVELGTVQYERNRAFAASVSAAGGYLFAVARTNRKALVDGASTGPVPARVFDDRSSAVAAALDQAGDRGVILYENDLPDHYP